MNTWTLAYRHPRANHFKRVTNWSGTWHQAYEMAGLLAEAGVQVYYVMDRDSEQREAVRLAQAVRLGQMTQDTANQYLEDHGNILVSETKRRVRMRETGTLSAELLARVPDPAEAKDRYEAGAL